ncbi:LAETG motif-containing sortase-dependent surface protein [Streptomyces sp. NPDC001678]|uniref:LAETG motif-containing sortase-dependent surface protein n=1 Tax=Streptomyces sp. NPDC001678 TaxID=3364599 RepID=UPI0036C2D6D8
MQISRIATIVAAGVITPALFLATPAVAEEQPGAAVRTTTEQGTQTVEQPGTVPAEKADKDKTPSRIPVSVHGIPNTLRAGADKPTTFQIWYDNRQGDADVAFTPHVFYLPAGADAGKADDYAIELWEPRGGTDPGWLPVDLAKQYSPDMKSFDRNGSLGPHVLKKGQVAKFDVQLNFGKQTPAHTARLRVTAENNVAATAEQEFSVLAAKEPKPSKSATATASTSATATATASGKATASPKPSTSASASATASPSASASSSADAAGTTSGGSSGSGGTTANGSRTELAATGSDPATPWIAAGGAVAIVAGAGLVVATRRRANAQG